MRQPQSVIKNLDVLAHRNTLHLETTPGDQSRLRGTAQKTILVNKRKLNLLPQVFNVLR
jgi:hypothetical protein